MAKSSDQANSRHLEVERKFEVFESTVSPSFEGLSSVARVERHPAQQLQAVYFDTPAHDLAARRITLRRRAGGTDAGWHLKLPAGAPGARRELQEPDADEIPSRLAAVVTDVTASFPLRPIAILLTERTVRILRDSGGSPLAEV